MLKYIRYVLVGIYCLLATLFGLVLVVVRPFHGNNTWLLGKIFGHGVLTIMGFDYEFRNRDKLPASPRIYLGNHQTNWDMFIYCCFIPERTVAMGKKEIGYIPFFGQLFWLAGNILINRNNRSKATDTMSQTAQTIIKRRISVVIFPEGTRSKGKGLLPFKKGAFYTAVEAQVNLVPICTTSYANTLNFNRWKSGKLIVDVLPEITIEGYTTSPEDIKALVTKARDRYLEAIPRLTTEV